MATAETARLIASLELQDKLSKGVKSAQGSLGKFESKWDKVRGKVGKGLAVGGAAAAAFVAVNVKAGLEELAELESATTSVDGAIKQMGLTGKVTSSQIATWANQIEADVDAAFDDKDITRAATTLIRFGKTTAGNIRPALEVITDLAVKAGSVDSAATLLAKALADPTKAAGKLTRQGINLNKQQQAQIKAFVKGGKVAEAQKVILDEVAKTTKNAARDAYGPYADSLNILQDVTKDAQKALAEGFLPVIEKVRDILAKGLADPNTMKTIREFGRGIAGGLDSAIEIARSLPWKEIGDGLRGAGTAAKVLFDAFRSMPPEVQATLVGLATLHKVSGGAITGFAAELAKGAIKGVLGVTAAVVNAKAGVVNVAGAVPGAGAGAGAAGGGGGLGKIGTLFAAGALTVVAAEIVNAFREGIAADRTAQGKDVSSTLDKMIANQPKREDLSKALDGINQGIKDLESNPLFALVQGDSLDELKKMRTTTEEQIRAADLQRQVTREYGDSTVSAVERSGRETASAIRNKSSTVNVTANVQVSVSSREVNAATTIQRLREHSDDGFI